MDQLLSLIESGITQLSSLELFFVIAALTFLQEDSVLLICAALVAQERMSFEMAFTANVTGVLLGDYALYGIAAWLGRYRYRDRIWILRRLLSPERLETGQKLFRRWGILIVFISKLTPAIRTPLYLSMGFLRSGFWSYAFAITVSCVVWIWIVLKGVIQAERLGILPIVLPILIFGIVFAQFVSWKLLKKTKTP